MRFTGTASYVATEDLTVAVNAAIRLERPLLVKGEPGTGKTVLAEEIARGLGAPDVWYLAINNFLRECVGICWYTVKGWI